MKINEILLILKGLKEKHGNIDIKLADKYMHYDIKWIDYSEAGNINPHVCIRINDEKIN